ncbi:transmembrane protein [Legionella beliardensis]|uniref:Transmembrane protein n=1 Tax=Legionella beliardensis TaxID=91822 RepID=A0A378I2Y2_9GAMM|nr:MAPEG family protein [Legionella beliardensis]STX29547.1 transmembrane protein [Legionella beliardensis]
MFTLILCLFIACLFPYLAKIPVVVAMNKQPGGHDNKHPRAQQASLKGWGARAVAAHQNSFESLLIFATACLTAIATRHTGYTIQVLAIIYLLSRVIYHALYLLNWSTLRTTFWALGYIVSLVIIWLCIPV